MIVKGLDNKEYKLILKSKPRQNASKPHIIARELLKKIFPNEIIYEEILLKGSKRFNKKDLYADFFIKSFMLLIEVHGEQHYKKGFFHKTKLEFIQAQSNDSRKREWCELNNIIYIELPSKESENEWKERIINAGND
jgi:hypothetical protein